MRTPTDRFLVWQPHPAPRFFSVYSRHSGSLDVWDRIAQGLPVRDIAPEVAEFDVNPRHPRNNKAPDSVYNTHGISLISRRLKAFLDDLGGRREFVPARIFDRRGKPISLDYLVLNCLDVYDAIDQIRSDIDLNPFAPEQIMNCTRLVVDEDAIPEDATVFRLRYMTNRLLVRRDTAERMEAAGFGGLAFRTFDEYAQ